MIYGVNQLTKKTKKIMLLAINVKEKKQLNPKKIRPKSWHTIGTFSKEKVRNLSSTFLNRGYKAAYSFNNNNNNK